MFESLPQDVGELARIVQGLAIHEFAADWYGVSIPGERRDESHIRPVERMLERIFALDRRPLTAARPPEKRLIGVCHHFMLLLVAMLRAKGVPVRGRRGFGAYFNPGSFEDHVVCEYWHAAERRWALADPQFDEVWRERLKIDHDVLDVPRDRFLVAADAWARCRTGSADPKRFGIIKGNLRGSWFIAGNLVHDVATLNKMELLQWDMWGAMPRPNQSLGEDEAGFFDDLAALTRTPDTSFEQLRQRYQEDERLRVPATVFNALHNRREAVAGTATAE
ncbi:MAG TPA: transglutaminase domain-containing protein [Gemmatimonadales bacterium]